jgi:hypothetical protein
VLGLEFLEANEVWLRFGQPKKEVLQPFADVVDVEGRILTVRASKAPAAFQFDRRATRTRCKWAFINDRLVERPRGEFTFHDPSADSKSQETRLIDSRMVDLMAAPLRSDYSNVCPLNRRGWQLRGR